MSRKKFKELKPNECFVFANSNTRQPNRKITKARFYHWNIDSPHGGVAEVGTHNVPVERVACPLVDLPPSYGEEHLTKAEIAETLVRADVALTQGVEVDPKVLKRLNTRLKRRSKR